MLALPHDRAAIVLDKNERIVQANDKWSALCGYTLDEARGERTTMLHGPATNAQKAHAFANEVRKNGVAKTVLANYTADGEPFVHKIEARRVHTAQGPRYLVESEEVTDKALRRAILKQPLMAFDGSWGNDAADAAAIASVLSLVMCASWAAAKTLV